MKNKSISFFKFIILCLIYISCKSTDNYQRGRNINQGMHSHFYELFKGDTKQKIRLVDANTFKPLDSEKVLITLDFPPYYYDGPKDQDVSKFNLDTIYSDKNGDIFIPEKLLKGLLTCRIYMSMPDNNEQLLTVKIDSNKITQIMHKYRAQVQMSEIIHLINPKIVKEINSYTQNEQSKNYKTIKIYVRKEKDKRFLLRHKLREKKEFYETNQDTLWIDLWDDFEEYIEIENLRIRPTSRIWYHYSLNAIKEIENLKLNTLIKEYDSINSPIQKFNLLVTMVTLQRRYKLGNNEFEIIEKLILNFYSDYNDYTKTLTNEFMTKDFLTRLRDGLED